jgi:predicted acylesterase/phospholipase RssA
MSRHQAALDTRIASRRRAATLMATALALLTARASVAETADVHPVIRVGVVDFSQVPKSMASVKAILDDAAATQGGSRFGRPIDFEILSGNYYQVLSWMKTSQIDAAIVSPFIAYLLVRDGATQLFELAEPGKGERFHYATIGLRRKAAGKWREGTSAEAVAMFERLLCGLLDTPAPSDDDLPADLPDADADYGGKPHCDSISGKADVAPINPAVVELNAVSHLSTSGLIAPMMFVKRWFAHQRRRVENPKVFLHRLGQVIRFRFSHNLPENDLDTEADKAFLLSFDYAATKDASYPADDPTMIPNDSFVVTRQGMDRLFLGAPNNAERRWVPSISLSEPNKGGYDKVLELSALQTKFQSQIETLFDVGSTDVDPVIPRPDVDGLRSLFHGWYEMEDFAFTIPETLDFLRKDQIVADKQKLALVLPGGGVKATYQAVLLDTLYKRRDLVNESATPLQRDRRSLVVNTVIGTSGGALMGLFTSLLDEATTASGTALTNHWLTTNASTKGRPATIARIVASNSKVFPWISVPRYVSLWFILLIVAFVFFLGNKAGAREPIQGTPFVGHLPSLGLCVLVIGTPVLVGYAITHAGTHVPQGQQGACHPELQEYLPLVEGWLYTVLLVAAHHLWTCGKRVPRGARSWAALGAFVLGAGVSLGALALERRTSPFTLPVLGWRVWLPSVLIAFGALISVGGLIVAGWRGKCGYQLEAERDYFAGLAMIAVTMVGALGLIGVGVSLGWYTYLELTGSYWLALLGSGLGAALVALAVRNVSRRSKDAPGASRLTRMAFTGFEYLNRSQRFMLRLDSSPIWTLTFVTLGGLILWLGFVTPALYANTKAEAFFESEVKDVVKQATPGDSFDLKTTLIVTTTNLKRMDDQQVLLPPDFYFCFGLSCPSKPSLGFYTSPTPTVNRQKIVDAVFASGSPFPIFPGHFVSSQAMTLIDGGFAHNTPVEAARKVDARQILIVNSSSSEMDPRYLRRESRSRRDRRASELVHNLKRLPGFLFDRSQEMDRKASSAFTVVAITPADDGDDAPFLGDFRPVTIRRMFTNAHRDLSGGRVGSIVSVGLPPAPLARLTAPPAYTAPDRVPPVRRIAP